jgi:glycine/D-amino acid oxidase-like deaminating enzyme/nitrite reductase/ring-hydroxylating ferredoxin subunit
MAENKESLWMHERPATLYPTLAENTTADVVVVGAGITGLTTAFLLKKAGLKVVLIEADRVCSGVTGHTTAKISSLQQLIYADLASSQGEDAARTFAMANQAAIDQVEAMVTELGIECDFQRLPAFTYTELTDRVPDIENEVEAAQKAGLPASFVEKTDLPFAVRAAIRLDNQARFHPARYCSGLAAAVMGDNGRIFEQSRVVEVDKGTVKTVDGSVRAEKVVLATQMPILDRGVFFASNFPKRSYLLAARIAGRMIKGMYISAEEPVRSMAPAAGGKILLVGGESHKTGQDPDTRKRYEALRFWAQKRFKVKEIVFEWSSQDYMPADRLPYIGYLHPFTRRVYVATGFGKWGMTRGTFAGMLIHDLILGRENLWADTFSATRIRPIRSGCSFWKENMNVGRRFVQDRLKSLMPPKESALNPGEGKIIKKNGDRAAAFRDDAGVLHAVSPVCTHMGCYVTWNAAEKSWDCPCHGSRFKIDGGILHGPATRGLSMK